MISPDSCTFKMDKKEEVEVTTSGNANEKMMSYDESKEMAGYSQIFLQTNHTVQVPEKPASYQCAQGQFDDDLGDVGSGGTLTDGQLNLMEVGEMEKEKPKPLLLQQSEPKFSGMEGNNNYLTEDFERRGYMEDEEEVPDNWEEDEDSEEDFDDFEFWDERIGPNSQALQALQKNFHTSDELFRKISSKINVEKFEGVENLPSGAGNKILTNSKKSMSQGVKVKDKQDRATVEQVLDPRTRMILYKLLSSGKIVTIDGCISTGKEANVYHATGPDNQALAIKIFKTSILTFKARDKYVSGEFRFRQGYCKKNPRKMVRLWAEKEYRNLLRIHSCGTIKVPHPKILKSHVLVMDFIGENGWPCPLLKDVKFNELDLGLGEVEKDNCQNQVPEGEGEDQDPVLKLLVDLYRQCLIILYRLFKHCKLVHADFSEFNLILKDDQELYVIDVSQSVEHDHPRSFDFLRHDIKNVQDFFGKHILVGDYQEIFEFITSPNIDDSNYERVLEGILKNKKKLETFNVSDEVFRQTHIPRKMQEVRDYERDYQKLRDGETEEVVYAKVMGMKKDMSGVEVVVTPSGGGGAMEVGTTAEGKTGGLKVGVGEEESENSEGNQGITDNQGDNEDSETDSESEGSDEGAGGGGGKEGGECKSKARPRNETQEEKKLRKQLVKEEKADKRKSKVKKHVKKRKEKLAHANSKR